MNADMGERWYVHGESPEYFRKRGVMRPECLLADEPQVFLHILIDRVRPNTDICTRCKQRALECLVRNASADNVYWNTIPDVLFPGEVRPVHRRLEPKLSSMGIHAGSGWGLDLSLEHLEALFEPETRFLSITDGPWADLSEAANYLCEGAWQYRGIDEQYQSSGLGDKLELMCRSTYRLQNLARDRHIGEHVLLFGRVLNTGIVDSDCTCPILDILEGLHPDMFSAHEWPAVVLKAARQRIDPVILSTWDRTGVLHPLSGNYVLEEDLDLAWIMDWKYEFEYLGIAWPTRLVETIYNGEYLAADARDYALESFINHELDRDWMRFQGTSQIIQLRNFGFEMVSAWTERVEEEQAAHDEAFGTEGCLFNGVPNLPSYLLEKPAATLRHISNSSIRRWWECEDDGSDPLEHPERWTRYV